MGKPHVQDALAHELVHAYDDRRFKPRGGKTWAEDLRSHACTEVSFHFLSALTGFDRFSSTPNESTDLDCESTVQIRAENLSGDCSWGREFSRQNFSFTKQHQVSSPTQSLPSFLSCFGTER